MGSSAQEAESCAPCDEEGDIDDSETTELNGREGAMAVGGPLVRRVVCGPRQGWASGADFIGVGLGRTPHEKQNTREFALWG